MAKEIKVGLVNEARTQVTEANIASTMCSGTQREYATPENCLLIEKAGYENMESQ